ncbi:MAG: helix-turn-helix domain-containing protein [Pseudonocardiaceae bacterium]
MSSAFGKDTARQRRLGVLLRKAAGRSGPILARRLGVSQSHLSRVELGEAVATVELVHHWTRETGASQADLTAATDLAEAVAGACASVTGEPDKMKLPRPVSCNITPRRVPGCKYPSSRWGISTLVGCPVTFQPCTT